MTHDWGERFAAAFPDYGHHPVHYLQDSRPLLDEMSAVSLDVFGVPLRLDALGRTLRLRVGEVGMDGPRINDIPVEYRDRMSGLRPLDDQGDGMRSLMGQLLPHRDCCVQGRHYR